MTEKLIEAIGLTRHHKLPGDRVLPALDGLDLAGGRGATLGLVGESGSGKSTLGRIVVGLQPPPSGAIRFKGLNVAADHGQLIRLPRQRQIVFQDPSGALNPRMTIGGTIIEHLRVQGCSRASARAREQSS